ncbi:MAG TPA: 3-ketoacyl-ACP reductase [Candidatus Didemnitutus sp.]|jgi:NAD(P)-dependent dehydrogenase (short-subunit alcohol dehydrogenase family)
MTKTALITGGSRGIGFGIAEKLAAEGWDLVINGVRSEDDAREALASLRQTGRHVTYVRGDIGTPGGRASIVEATRSLAGGAANLLVNNAGVAPKVRADILETTEDSYNRVVDTNLKGAFFLTQEIARQMVAARRADPAFPAAIVNVSSISAAVVSTNRGEYCIAKAGLAMVTQLFAARLGAEGIPVYEMRPGVIRTDMTSGVVEKYDRLIEQGLMVQPRWGLPADVGRAVAAVARGDFPYSTGQIFMIDGGMTIPRL